jgi:hypothetical protein
MLRHAALPAELQQVQHLAHLVVIGPKGDGPLELRRRHPAQRALGHAHAGCKPCRLHPQRIAAARTQNVCLSLLRRAHQA